MEILANKPKKRFEISKLIGKIFVVALAVIMIYPLIWMFMSSFKESNTILPTAASLWPENWTWENYPVGWQGISRNETFGTFFFNSFVIASLSTIGTVLSSSLVAYSFSRGKFRGRKLLFALTLGTMMLPAQVLMIPQFLWFNQLGWVNSYKPLIIPSYFATQGFFVFLMTNFMNAIPRELDDAARIDGCSFYGIYGRVVLPLSVPVLITATIFSFMWRWDDFVGPLLYLRNVSTYPASLALRSFSDPASATPFGPIFAMSILSLIPLVLIFFLLQRYLVEGITTTGLKG